MDKNLTPEQCVKEARKVTWVGFWCNAALGSAKIVVGFIAASSALVADGVHSFSDFISDLIVLAMVGVARKKPDKQHLYGHGKYETLATILLAIVLCVVAVKIITNAASQIADIARGAEIPRPGALALVICAVSIIIKEWLYRYTRRVGLKIHSEAVVANAWHHRSDSFSSIATLAGVAGAMFLGPHGRICDPLSAIIVGIFIIIVSYKIARPAILEMLESSLPDDDISKISAAVRSTPGVLAFHNLRTRRSGANVIIDLHIKVDPKITVEEGHRIATAVEDNIKEIYGRENAIVTVHMEPYHPAEQRASSPERVTESQATE